MFLVVGLGNPDPEYLETRHNIGFMAADELQKLFVFPEFRFKRKCNALVSEGENSGRKVIIAKPQTYMNNSGNAIASLVNWNKIPPGQIIIIYDDLDLPMGSIRIRQGGSSGGHKGIESAIKELGNSDFLRIRIGIGRDPVISSKDYVLQNIPGDQKQMFLSSTRTAAEAAAEIVAKGLQSSMNKFNK